jgi:hypothetical protein
VDRTFIRTVVVFVIALLAGLFIGRWSAPGTWDPAPDEREIAASADEAPGDAEAPSARSDSAEPAATRAPAPAAEERVRELEAEVSELQRRLESAGVRPPAAPVAWPEGRPDKFTEAGLRASMQTALESCDVPAELVGLECAEPPCIAMLRTTSDGWHDALVNSCPAWNDTYGTTVSMDDGKVDCGGGESESVALLSPYDHEWREELDKDASGNVGQRLQERWTAIRGDWDCR